MDPGGGVRVHPFVHIDEEKDRERRGKDGETPPQGDKDRGPAEAREGPPGPASAETEHGAARWGRRRRQGAAKEHSEGRSHDLKDREPSSGGPHRRDGAGRRFVERTQVNKGSRA